MRCALVLLSTELRPALLVLGVGLCGTAAQLALTFASSRDGAGRVGVIGWSQIGMAATIDVWVFGVPMHILTKVGRLAMGVSFFILIKRAYVRPS